MKKWTISLLCLLMACFFCSCSQNNQTAEVISLTIWGSEQQQDLLQEMADRFSELYSREANLKITVCEESEGTCRGTVLFCPEAAADVFCFADDQLVSLVEAEALLPITFEANLVMQECGGEDSVAIDAASVQGTLYSYPSTASNGYFLYYNSKYLTDQDVRSLDTILETAQKNNKKFGMDFTSGWYLYSFYTAAGMFTEITEDGTSNTCNFNKKTGPYTGVDVTNAILKIAMHPAFENINNDAAIKGINDGSLIAFVSGTWNAASVQEAFGDGYAACKLPTYTVDGTQLQMHSVAGYKLFGVNAHSKHPEWAQKLARYITNEQNQLKRFEVVGEGPANIQAAQSESVQSSVAIAALSEQMQYGHLQRVAGSYWDETFKLGNILLAGNIENRDIQELLDEMVAKVTGEDVL